MAGLLLFLIEEILHEGYNLASRNAGRHDKLRETINQLEQEVGQTRQEMNKLKNNLKQRPRMKPRMDIVEAETMYYQNISKLSVENSQLRENNTKLEKDISNLQPKVLDLRKLMDSLRDELRSIWWDRTSYPNVTVASLWTIIFKVIAIVNRNES